MDKLFAGSELADIAARVEAGERLSFEDGLRLYQSTDLLTVGHLADLVRRRKNGDRVYFIVNRHINHTNICINRCKLCAFGREKDDPGAYRLSLDEVEAKARQCRGNTISEIHIVGGLNPELKLDYYLEMLQRVRKAAPGVIIQSFTAVEVDYLARIHDLPVQEVLRRLQEAGLDSLPGGGAEIFARRVRDRICEQKISGERWLEVHEAAHRIGMRTNATMLYGHIETIEERLEHLIQLRELQDRTGGFLTFITFPFLPKNTGMEDWPLSRTTGYDDLKTLAISRLMLDNFDHIKAFWIMLTPKIAQISLSFGVDDLDGTVVEEQIMHDAGAETDQYMPVAQMVRLIKDAGRIPVQRDTLYNVVREGF
ncbi:aminofutalosine synthase MqnE [Desulfotomaculum copahuensis]|uniref:Aminodeoxyfutalosine synthase n=1 Tax=Desulfotomaculum copahuensis TaxID=1838280 RepID=A0A1B7LH14_9FIRM|nr:aminofutalosine synthase MqnE [Desulfotomaculum copahuensis]OAT85490.1 aminofutalosine synthase MqnE [Desulfotomaculum copahuensis]